MVVPSIRRPREEEEEVESLQARYLGRQEVRLSQVDNLTAVLTPLSAVVPLE